MKTGIYNVAVEKGADENESFAHYVEYLYNENYIPRGGKEWVDKIRTKGNEANHEIVMMSEEEAEELIVFVSYLLSNTYDLPSRAPNNQNIDN